MTIETIAILMPGDMGHGCAVAFSQNGFRVITCLAGHSARTRGLALAAKMEDLGSFEAVVRQADIILSILPPESALAQSRSVADAMIAVDTRPPYADCNAISPATARKVGAEIARAGAIYIDAGIIGRNPLQENGRTRFYASGPDTTAIVALDGRGVLVRTLGEDIGRASALKMIYASATKGTFSLHAAVLTVAQSMGLTEAYLEEIGESQPAMLAAMERMAPASRSTRDAGSVKCGRSRPPSPRWG